MSLASRARETVREHPFLFLGLRAGVVNHRAAAEFLGLEGDPDAVATALRRFADTLPEYRAESRDARVTMHSGVGVVDGEAAADADESTPPVADADDPTLRVGDTVIAPDAGDATAVVATGDVDAAALWAVLGRLATDDVDAIAAGVDDATLVVVVERRAGATALRLVEAALSAVPA